MNVELYPHQQKAVDEMHNGCVLWGGVGTGKTITALAYYWTKVMKGVIGDQGSIREPMDLYIFTTAKKRDSLDWEADAAKFGIGREPEVNPHGISITVDSWNNIGNYVGIKNAFMVADEQRVVGSGAWVKAFIKIARNNQWVLLSATPGDTWLDYIPVFIANGFYKNRTEFKREHVVYNTFSKFPKVDRYIGVGRLVKLRNSILVEMPYKRHTVRHEHEVLVDYDVELFERVVKKRWHVYENRPLRDVAEMFSVMRKVVNSDPSRIETLKELLKKHPRVIVFYNFDYELEMLRTLAGSTLRDESGPDLSMKRSSSSSVRINTGCSVKGCDSTRSASTQSPSGTQAREQTQQPADTTSLSLDPLMRESISSASAVGQTSATSRSLVDDSTSGTCCTSSGSTCRSDGLRRGEGCLTSRSSGPKLSETGRNSTRTARPNSSSSEDRGLSTAEPHSRGCSISKNTSIEETSFALAEWNGHKHEEIPKTDRWVYLVQYVAGSEGWNCVETDAICFYSLTYSYKNFEQAHGRIDRLNTPFTDLHYYVLRSDSLIDKAVRRSLLSKKNFNESSFGQKLM